MHGTPASTAPSRNWFGQPPGLTVLFLTNMWEQFSYFGMRALLVYYMTRQLMLGQVQASFVYGAYTACAYFTPILGGMIADRWLGKRRAVMLGATIMAAGHFMMAFEPLFYAALATIALGNGLFLPSLPSQINDLYAPGDPRRGWAYNVYYLGINIGGFLAPLICGTLGELYGWHYGFGAAGIGMFVGLLVYLLGQRHLPPERLPLSRTQDETQVRPGGERRIWMVLAAVGLCVTVFRGAYEQVGNTVALWADSGIDRQFGSLTIPMTWFQALNPLLVMMLTPPLLSVWRKRADAGREAAPARRMTQGALIVALAYALLAIVSWQAGNDRADWLWLVAFFVLFTTGELFILPTGLGLFARLAPPRLGATTVAAWYLAIFAGSLSAGLVGMLWSRMEPGAYFALLSAIAVAAAMLLYFLDPAVRRVDRSWTC
jgi:POT family proton-dependent oligopeptide transporter